MKTKVFYTLLVLAIFAQPISAQENEKRFGFELSSGASIALDKLNDAKLKPGFTPDGAGTNLVAINRLLATMLILKKPVT